MLNVWTGYLEQDVENLYVDGAIRAACLSFPLRSHGKGEESLLRYPSLCSSDLKDCFLHLRFESNSAIEQDEALLAHIATRNVLSWDSFTASRAGKTNLYQTLHVHVHEHNNIKLAFRWCDTK